jgi:NAD+ diphosphatase
MQHPIAFAGNPLDRAAAQRKDEAWIAAQRRRADAELLVFYKGEPLHERREGGSRLLFLGIDALAELRDPELVLLGLKDGVPLFAADGSSGSGLPGPPFAELGKYGGLRSLSAFLPLEELAIAGQAAWLLDWHRRHRFCARHGGPTVSAEGGGKRVNPKTGTEHFPRTDPVCIVLPLHGDRACLGRGPHFPAGMMSAFAGFMEPGETLEECAARELLEETGLAATALRYVRSQPWPFPSSLMVGFEAEVESEALTLDPVEIAEARWFTRDEVAGLLAGEGPKGYAVPPPLAIAHQLLKAWAAR